MMNMIGSMVAALVLSATPAAAQQGTVTVWPAPAGEELSKDFTVAVNGKASPVYVARVPPKDKRSATRPPPTPRPPSPRSI